MSKFRKVVHNPGELINFETVFEENPYLRTGVPSKKGSVEKLEYTTSVYDDGKTYTKEAYVYLPYCYDKEDRSRRYNVVYFQHGNTCEPSMFVEGGNKPMFDMLFDSGEIEPCIMVFVTYYMDPLEDAEHRVFTGDIPAGDGLWPGLKGNYYREVVESIIPAVETRYNTYLEEATAEGIKATRDHRAFSGYSRGGAMTWGIFHHDFEYFRWYAPMSGMTWGDPVISAGESILDVAARSMKYDPKEVEEYITAPIKANPGMPFFIYVSNGGPEDLVPLSAHVDLCAALDCFSYGNDPAVNNIYYSVSDYYHTDYLVPYYYWNSLKVLFKGI